jgi:hypothetical protein
VASSSRTSCVLCGAALQGGALICDTHHPQRDWSAEGNLQIRVLLSVFCARPYTIDVCAALGMTTADARKAVSRAAFELRHAGAPISGFRGHGYRWRDPTSPAAGMETTEL